MCRKRAGGLCLAIVALVNLQMVAVVVPKRGLGVSKGLLAINRGYTHCGRIVDPDQSDRADILDMDTSNHLRSLEERLLDPAVRRDSEQVSALLADDFVEVGSSGRTFDKAQVLESLRNELPLEEALIRNFVAKPLCSTVFLVTYRTTRRDASGVHRSHSWRCSIWVKRDGRWQLQFHQGTSIPVQRGEER
jgi:hypothetical protein